MPRFSDPKFPYCFVDCDRSGNATYIPEVKRCIKNCGEDGLMHTVREILDKKLHRELMTTSAQIDLYDLSHILHHLRNRESLPPEIWSATELLSQVYESFISKQIDRRNTLRKFKATNVDLFQLLLKLSSITYATIQKSTG